MYAHVKRVLNLSEPFLIFVTLSLSQTILHSIEKYIILYDSTILRRVKEAVSQRLAGDTSMLRTFYNWNHTF